MKKINSLQNLHTHTTYCDGVNTPEQIVTAAIEKGFGAIGFSEHSYMHYSKHIEINMDAEKTKKYKAEIASLKKKYKDKIDIFCGLEFDIYSDIDMAGYDYLIGSVHYLKVDGEFVGFDESSNTVREVIDTYFDRDGMKYAKAYYQTLAQLPNYGDFDIIGHFDLITKHSDSKKFFDDRSEEYRGLVIEAADALRGKIPLFEVNTGAIARGYRITPYPMMYVIKELKNMGFGVCITSDCHNMDYIDCAFKESEELLKACGFKEKYILTKQGFVSVEL